MLLCDFSNLRWHAIINMVDIYKNFYWSCTAVRDHDFIISFYIYDLADTSPVKRGLWIWAYNIWIYAINECKMVRTWENKWFYWSLKVLNDALIRVLFLFIAAFVGDLLVMFFFSTNRPSLPCSHLIFFFWWFEVVI